MRNMFDNLSSINVDGNIIPLAPSSIINWNNGKFRVDWNKKSLWF